MHANSESPIRLARKTWLLQFPKSVSHRGWDRSAQAYSEPGPLCRTYHLPTVRSSACLLLSVTRHRALERRHVTGVAYRYTHTAKVVERCGLPRDPLFPAEPCPVVSSSALGSPVRHCLARQRLLDAPAEPRASQARVALSSLVFFFLLSRRSKIKNK